MVRSGLLIGAMYFTCGKPSEAPPQPDQTKYSAPSCSIVMPSIAQRSVGGTSWPLKA